MMDWCVKDTFQYFITKAIVLDVYHFQFSQRQLYSFIQPVRLTLCELTFWEAINLARTQKKLKQKNRLVSILLYISKCHFGYLGTRLAPNHYSLMKGKKIRVEIIWPSNLLCQPSVTGCSTALFVCAVLALPVRSVGHWIYQLPISKGCEY